VTPPSSLAALKDALTQGYEGLTPKLRLAARFLVDHPNDAAVGTVKSLAEQADVTPAILVRLAQALGYAGFSDMQAVFRSALLANTQSYGERMRAQRDRSSDDLAAHADLISELCDGAIQSLEGLRASGASPPLQQAIDLIASARVVHVLGRRRSLPIATYLTYLLSRTQKLARLTGAMGGMLPDELMTMSAQDVLVVISFHPFHPDPLEAVEHAQRRGIPVIVITDVSLSALTRGAAVVLQSRDPEVMGIRSVSASMVLCHGIAVGLALREVEQSRDR
jgi:DNA-binding MurR/RpiR family transcriptional regulator